MKKDKGLHPRNIHRKDYDFEALIKDHPTLSKYVNMNQYGSLGVDFSDSSAVVALNQAILIHHYKVENWSIPKGNLCPPIPGRADYIHYIADLLAESNSRVIPVGTKVKGLDIGTGTSCIYPILGRSIYGWKFVGSDISSEAINNTNTILSHNPNLKKNIKARFQKSSKHIFQNLIKNDEKFDFTMCNPPFYESLDQANKESARKIKNLNKNKEKKGHELKVKEGSSNFGGLKAELWCLGGEVAFIKRMIEESVSFKNQCNWFTTLVSNKDHLPELYQQLSILNTEEVRTIEMNQGRKIVHILAWKF
jgi:23S rRNA (adenine1618-N6)-methyltransferase